MIENLISFAPVRVLFSHIIVNKYRKVLKKRVKSDNIYFEYLWIMAVNA